MSLTYPTVNQSFQPTWPAQLPAPAQEGFKPEGYILDNYKPMNQFPALSMADSYSTTSPKGGGAAPFQQGSNLNTASVWTPTRSASFSNPAFSNPWSASMGAAALGGMAAGSAATSTFNAPTFKPQPSVQSSASITRPASVRASAPPVVELSPAEQTGKKVGALVTKLLEENPGLQEKFDNIDLHKMQENLGPSLERYRVSLNQAVKRVPRKLDNFILRQFPDPQMKEHANQLITWVRKPVDPKVLAAIQREKRTDAAAKALEAELNAVEEEAPKPGLLRRLTTKVWPFGKDKASASTLSDAEVDALLGGTSRPMRRIRPAIEEY